MKALVIVSGNLESTIALAVAKRSHSEIHAITFESEQQHCIELSAAVDIGEIFGTCTHEIISLRYLLRDSGENFIPARNHTILSIAANRACELDCPHIYTGLCKQELSPDTTQKFVDAMRIALGEGIYGNRDAIQIHTPLMNRSRPEAIRLAANLLGNRFNDVIISTHNCDRGVRGGCGSCKSCVLRDNAFRQAGIVDPLWAIRLPENGLIEERPYSIHEAISGIGK